ncbi:hypothetical protein HK102_003698 [Quaeritorhiza haematococci]|nr:hypothetical protein HK102_003698 [Quaeritorhiza haematococci]
MEGSSRTVLNYLDQLQKFHQQQGTPFNKIPHLDKKPVDLYKLKKEVAKRGGHQAVTEAKGWAQVGRSLGLGSKTCTSLSNSVKIVYFKWIQPYEQYLAHNARVYHQQTASSSSSADQKQQDQPQTQQRRKSSTSTIPTPTSDDEFKPRAQRRKSPPSKNVQQNVKQKQITPPPTSTSAGMQKGNAHGQGQQQDGDGDEGSSRGRRQSNRRKAKPESIYDPNVTATQPQSKRSSSASTSRAASPGKMTRSASTASSVTGATAVDQNDYKNPILPENYVPRPGEELCEVCGGGEDAEHMLLCDGCNRGHHLYCLTPPLRQIPNPAGGGGGWGAAPILGWAWPMAPGGRGGGGGGGGGPGVQGVLRGL